MAYIKSISTVLSTIALLSATPALALSVSTGVDGAADVHVGNHVGVGVNLDTAVNASSNSEGSTSASEGADMNEGASAQDDLAIPLVVTHASVSANPVQISAGNVGTRSDLSSFVSQQLRIDANLSGVDTASDHVAVTYREPALFLGIVPVSIETTATTDASGNVTITEPWWNFLAASNETNLQTKVKANVDAVLGDATASAKLTAAQQAQLVSAITSAMASVHASASTSASAAGTVNTK
ncbi:MAG: hypothetical protein P4L81_04915 [Candidatus Pacebacteria bacterium]|nr:hypothetical protein [Candidatus Paceibacterota bacterium]